MRSPNRYALHACLVCQSVWVRLSEGDETVRHEVVVLLTVARAADDIFTDNRWGLTHHI